MKIISSRELRLNQLEIILIDEEGNKQSFYPHLEKNKNNLERITRGRRITKLEIKGTINAGNVDILSNWITQLKWCFKKF